MCPLELKRVRRSEPLLGGTGRATYPHLLFNLGGCPRIQEATLVISQRNYNAHGPITCAPT